jgi:hypothetical protein
MTCLERRGGERMVVGYTTTYAISAYMYQH